MIEKMIRDDNENLNYSEEAREMYCIPHPQRVTTKSKLQARWNMAGKAEVQEHSQNGY